MSSEGGSDYNPSGLYRSPPGRNSTAFLNQLAITHTAFLRGFNILLFLFGINYKHGVGIDGSL